jgi:hypothetical protein
MPITVSLDLYLIQDYTGIGIFITPRDRGQRFDRLGIKKKGSRQPGRFMKNA